MTTKVALGSDHAGFEMKSTIKTFLPTCDKNYKVKDYGCFTCEAVDYPNFAHAVALAISNGEFNYGLLFCGSANGMAITSNKHQAVRAAVCWNEEVAILARKHNDANILCIPARFTDMELAKKIVRKFLKTDFEGGRHKRRVKKINF